MKASDNTILVTGGGSGIGRALAHRWHDAGNRVIVTGRRQAMLDETAQGRPNIFTQALDIGEAGSIEAAVRAILGRHPRLNVLVNNAGTFANEQPTRQRDLSDAEQMVNTNFLGFIRMTDALIEHLKRQRDAALVNVSSGLGFVPLPAAPTYSATKAAMHAYTAALRPLLTPHVEVIEIVPPKVQTELSPGQSRDPHSMPLDAFADEVMALLHAAPTPAEVCVERVRYLREAQAKGHFDEALARMVELMPHDA